MKRFLNLLSPKCTVIRDGKIAYIYTENLVIGDIVKCETG